MLHRAFSVFIFRDQQLLLQQRSLHKYHSPGLWTNTCCSHPRPHESVIVAGKRRLYEELGIHVDLMNVGFFHYNAHFENGLSENEIDHVLVGTITDDIKPSPNQNEIHALRWVSLSKLAEEIKTNSDNFTPWFEKALAIAVRNVV